MEGPGRKIEHFCEPCGDTGQKLLATGFCVDCSEFLCRECYKHHCTPRPLRNHVLQDKESMPKTKPTFVSPKKDTDNESICSKHNEKIKFYCLNHKVCGCGSCMTKHHRKCDEPSYIEDEYEKFESKVNKLNEQLKQHSQEREQIVKSIKATIQQSSKTYNIS